MLLCPKFVACDEQHLFVKELISFLFSCHLLISFTLKQASALSDFNFSLADELKFSYLKVMIKLSYETVFIWLRPTLNSKGWHFKVVLNDIS